ncbi:aminotransferase class V-fold PLP-dependent enzyme [Saccharothrix yanglingensis]|uniref:Probable hercynylcysteine sulfoxide lyase n=1 Tax=Saccharothrix yanglingensis TaxID=659496 RepID=A0ABU0X7M8_9PSEU|nr:aminotransferase class V-fold PLP-dependent enzyme [Saccharothrix yanglingensis]MDQ2588127.1 aminotransferase [Saccharothrix yanglingensis]
MTIFLDSAGSSLPPREVVDEVVAHLRREAEVGGYLAAEEREADLEAGYGLVAELLGARPDEVAFTDSATRSWLTAFDAVPLAEGDRVLISEAEYAGTAIPILRRTREVGAVAEVVPSDPRGQVDLDALTAMLDERVKLVSLTHAPTNSGLVNPAREVAAAAHEVGALVLLDACQSIGQLPVRADELGVDVVTGTGRKWLRGPRGTGVLVVRRAAAEVLRPRLVDLHGARWTGPGEVRLREDARVHEVWETSVADRLGLLAAVRHALAKGLDVIEREVGERAGRLRDGLSALSGVTVRDIGERRSGIVTFTADGLAADEVKRRLAGRGVTVTVSGAPSTLLDMTRRGLTEVVRASPHYFVGLDEVDRAVRLVGEVTAR